MSFEPTAPSIKYCSLSTETNWARMRFWVLALLTFNLSFLTIQCGLDIEDPTPPTPPVWVQKSLPEEWPERGIDAHESGGIFLEWESGEDENISAYWIYRAEYSSYKDSLGVYLVISIVETESKSSSEYIDANVDTRTRYFYKMKAKDLSGNESAFSDSIGYQLLPHIYPFQMKPNGQTEELNSLRLLEWDYNYNIEMENYCLTLLCEQNNLINRVILTPTNYVDATESWEIPDSVNLEINQVYRWRIDTGAIYMNGVEGAGSESAWATFLYIGS
jgi:hypothetical protein